MKIKKIIAAICAAGVALCLAGCGNSAEELFEGLTAGNSTPASSSSKKPAAVSSSSKRESEPTVSEPESTPTVSEPISEPTSEPTSVPESVPEDNNSEGAGGILSGLTFEGIFNDYAKQIDEVTEQCMAKMNANKSDLDKLSDVSAEGIDKIADLCAEGIDKMADRIGLNAIGYSEWSTKLTTKYMTKSQEITSKYMELSMNATMDEYNHILDDAFGGFNLGF